MDKDFVYEKVKEVLLSILNVKPEFLGPDALLEKDLELDSLDVVDILIGLEEHIDSKAQPALLKDAKTVQDLVDLLKPLWKQGENAPS